MITAVVQVTQQVGSLKMFIDIADNDPIPLMTLCFQTLL
jgi:hypothetical protein